MIKQIKRFAPHQTAKVLSVLMAIGSLPVFVPMILMSIFASPMMDEQGNPVDFPIFMLVMFPIFYLLFGYISVRIGCWFYNLMFKYIGGFEFELTDSDNT